MKNYNCEHAKICATFDKDNCQACFVCRGTTKSATALKAEAEMAARTSHDAVFALAMNHDPATLIVGNTRMKVLITDVDSCVSPESAPDIKLRCQVVDCAVRASFADRFTPAEKAYLRNETILAATFAIDRVIFNDPATIVYWKDGAKTVVKCQEGDTYSAETGLALCFAKKALGNKGNFNDVFKKYVPEEKVEETPVKEAVEAAEPEEVEAV